MSSLSENSQYNRLINKKVKKSRTLCSFENKQGFREISDNDGTCAHTEVSSEITRDGRPVLKTVYSNRVEDTEHINCFRLRFDYDNEDWSGYNRISFWIYPVKQGKDFYASCVEFKSVGEYPFPDSNWLSGIHDFAAVPNKWNRIVWEFPELSRDCVTMFQINFPARGIDNGDPDTAIVYLSDLRLEEVEADKPKGWDMFPNRIAFCHSGYSPNDVKRAVAADLSCEIFEIINCASGETVFTGKAQRVSCKKGNFSVLDFSNLCEQGNYKISYGGIITPEFTVSNTHYLPLADKLRNFFKYERCGAEVEGIHGVCHKNAYAVHPVNGKKLSASGGWHDAGDLSQGLCNTAEAVHTFLNFGESVKEIDPQLSEKMYEEARHGLKWLLATRFGDGYRLVWNTSRFWTDEFDRNTDVFDFPASNASFENFCAVSAEAEAYKAFAKSDAEFAKQCLDAALTDFDCAYKVFTSPDNNETEKNFLVQLKAQAAFAALSLFEITGESKYADIAAENCDYITLCQQTELPDWDIPIRGFFYENSERRVPVNYDHRGHEQVMLAALCKAVELLPDDPHRDKWLKAAELYGEYILKLSEFSQPYGYLPAAIYFEKFPPALTYTGDHKKDRAGKDFYEYLRYAEKIGEGIYIRNIPIFYKFRGSYGIILSRAKAISLAAKTLNSDELLQIAKQQIGWVVGNNPFSRSFVYGEGYDYPNMFTEFLPDVAGEIAVGMNCQGYGDAPYAPCTNQATYNEVWVHSASRMLWTLSDLI